MAKEIAHFNVNGMSYEVIIEPHMLLVAGIKTSSRSKG